MPEYDSGQRYSPSGTLNVSSVHSHGGGGTAGLKFLVSEAVSQVKAKEPNSLCSERSHTLGVWGQNSSRVPIGGRPSAPKGQEVTPRGQNGHTTDQNDQ